MLPLYAICSPKVRRGQQIFFKKQVLRSTYSYTFQKNSKYIKSLAEHLSENIIPETVEIKYSSGRFHDSIS